MDNPIPFSSLTEENTVKVPFAPTQTAGVVTTAPVTEDIIDRRAAKYDFALGDKSPGIEEMKNRLLQQYEESDRNKYALEKQIERSQLKREMITDLSNRAAAEGRNLDPIESQTILQLSNADLDSIAEDPSTFFETEFARRVVNTASNIGFDGPVRGAIVEQGEEPVMQKMDILQQHIAFKEAYQRLAEDTYASVSQQSWPGYLADFAKGAFPFYTWLKLRNVVSDEGGAIFPGNNFEEQIQAAYSGDLKTTFPRVKAQIEALKRDNPQLAAAFAHGLVAYASDDKFLDNVLTPTLDVTSIVGPLALARGVGRTAEVAIEVGKGVAKKSATKKAVKEEVKQATRQLDAMNKDIAKTVARPNVTTEEVLDAAGDVATSSTSSVVRKIQDAITNGGQSGNAWKDLVNEVPGYINAGEVVGLTRTALSMKATEKLITRLVEFRDKSLQALILDPLKQDQFGPNAIKEAMDLAARRFKDVERREFENSIMNIYEKPLEGGLGNHAAIIRIGDESAEPFENMRLAEIRAELAGLKDYQITPAGNGWSIDLERPLDFTDRKVRQAMVIDAQNAPTPVSNIIGKLLTSIRTADEVLPQNVVEKLKRATYGTTGLEKVILERAKDITRVKDPKDFFSFIKSQQMEVDPKFPEKHGRFSNTLPEFQEDWYAKFDRLPTEAEFNAYFAYKQLNDIQYFGLNLGLYLDKNVAGLTMHHLPGVPDLVEGKLAHLDDFIKYSEKEPARILFLEGDEATPFFGNSQGFQKIDEAGTKFMSRVKEAVEKEGYVVTQLSPIGRKQITKFDPENKEFDIPVDFVISKTSKAENIPLRNVPHRGGGHHINPDGFYVSEPDISVYRGVSKYYGDTNIFFAANERIAREVAKNFTEAKKIYRELKTLRKEPEKFAAKREELQKFIRQNLPITPSQFMKDIGKRGRLSEDSPVLHRASNQSLDDAHKLDTLNPGYKYIREKDSFYNLYRGRVNLQYALEREGPIMQVYERGSAGNPLYGMKPTEVIDPASAMDQSLSSMLRNRFIEPLKLQLAERFVSEFGDLLVPSTNEISLNPFVALREGNFKSNLSGNQLERLQQAKSFRARTLQFLNVESQDTKLYKFLGTKLLAGNKDAEEGLRKSLSEILLEKDPISQVRHLTYHMIMGIFNPKVLIQQANTWTNVIGLAGPSIGTRAGVLAMIQNMVLMNPNQLTDFGANTARKLGLKAEEFLWATEDLRRTGFGTMGREVATREQNLNAKIIQTKFGKVLDWGLIFMRKGEEFVRRTAWNAAYMEHLAKFGRRPNDNELVTILNRADLMNVNMSRASNASWNTGLTGITTQFWSYQARLMELYTGKRLTTKEKMRLFSTYSAIYGIPVATSGAVGVWPVHESVKEWLIQHNIDSDSNIIAKTLNDGALSMITEWVLDGDTNIESVMGPAGLPFFKDLIDGDKNVVEALAGASGNTIFNVIANVAPAAAWIKAAINPNEEAIPVKAQDFIDVFSNIRTISTVQKAYLALTAHQVLSKRNELIKTTDSALRSLFTTTLGIQDQDISDMYATFKVNQDFRDLQSKLTSDIKKDVRAMILSTSTEDKLKYLKTIQIKSLSLNDPIKAGRLLSDVMRENGDLITRSGIEHAKQTPEAREYEMKKLKERLNQ